MGPMQALELVTDRATREPSAQAAKDLVAHCRDKGLILMACGNHGNVIRTLMPLVIEDAHLQRGLDILEGGLAAISRTS